MRISDWSSDVCSSDLLQHLLSDLQRSHIVELLEDGRWLLTRDLQRVTLGDLHAGCRLRVPVEEMQLPFQDDMIGKAAIRGLNALREPLREGLRSEEHTSELQSLMSISYAVFCLKQKK